MSVLLLLYIHYAAFGTNFHLFRERKQGKKCDRIVTTGPILGQDKAKLGSAQGQDRVKPGFGPWLPRLKVESSWNKV